MSIATPNLESAIAKAVARQKQLGLDLADLAQHTRQSAPTDLNSSREQQERKDFLESLYHEDREAEQAFERIIAGNELQDANFLARGGLVSRAVARIVLRGPGGAERGFGTGFMVGDGVLITNNHVLRNPEVAATAEAQFRYERDLLGNDQLPVRFALEPQRLFYTHEKLDFSIVAVAPLDRSGQSALSGFGWLPLIGGTGKAMEGEWLTIIQHPQGQRKQLCVRENQLIKRADDVLWYSTDTLAGSSGSPVFNNGWLVVALHHSGVPEMKGDKWQTIDGRDYQKGVDSEDKIKWVANEGIRVSRIIQNLTETATIASHPLVRSVLQAGGVNFDAMLPVVFPEGKTPAAVQAAMALVHASPTAQGTPPETVPQAAARPSTITVKIPGGGQEADMARRITVTLEVDDDGDVRVVGSGSTESAEVESERTKKQKIVVDAAVDEHSDWVKGFETDFLGSGNLVVDLPQITGTAVTSISQLLPKIAYGQAVPDSVKQKEGVLHYLNYSVVINKNRKLAFYSAANVDGGSPPWTNLDRPRDRWLFDERIDRAHQLGPNYYASNKVDRGHLTRREDLEWGPNPVDATRRANGTCTWTNCVPQHELFNQDRHPDRNIRLWHGLERYILEDRAREHQFRVQVFTGPIFSEIDPVYRKEKIPLDFWKIVVAVDSTGSLFATGYILSQRDVLIVDQLDEAALDVPFGKFELYQREISEIETVTHLKFTFANGKKKLSDVDPLAKLQKKPAWQRRRRRRGVGAMESFEGVGEAHFDDPLESFDDIILG